ncbi:hypothetical protein [Nonomuraea rhizosphaerae]|uniref:hypothetical protein n=1 Tax=Nonomuraea rhizosphaerae TaxID=2665663 RepID=UPI001C5E6600|nr:hypothetical protein [Nonomuraea rhizosphaerae]
MPRVSGYELTIDDYHGLFGALDDLVGITGREEFHHAVLRALAGRFGWNRATVLDGLSGDEVAAGKGAATHVLSGSFAADLERWRRMDPARTRCSIRRASRLGLSVLSDRCCDGPVPGEWLLHRNGRQKHVTRVLTKSGRGTPAHFCAYEARRDNGQFAWALYLDYI